MSISNYRIKINEIRSILASYSNTFYHLKDILVKRQNITVGQMRSMIASYYDSCYRLEAILNEYNLGLSHIVGLKENIQILKLNIQLLQTHYASLNKNIEIQIKENKANFDSLISIGIRMNNYLLMISNIVTKNISKPVPISRYQGTVPNNNYTLPVGATARRSNGYTFNANRTNSTVYGNVEMRNMRQNTNPLEPKMYVGGKSKRKKKTKSRK
jgi:hypothetical protein